MREWPLTTEEIRALKHGLSQKMSLLQILNKYSRSVEPISSSSFTHRCICPNPAHKGGNERTPSFYFSETDKEFVCWGCGLKGSIFDLLEVLLNEPADKLAKEYARRENISLEQCLKDLPALPQFDIEELNSELGIELREHLRSLQDTPKYNEEYQWVEQMLKRIDDRFDKLDPTDHTKARNFFLQIQMELERRK